MVYKRENTPGLAIKTVASRLLSCVKEWGDTEVNQSPESQAEDGNIRPSSDFVRNSITFACNFCSPFCAFVLCCQGMCHFRCPGLYLTAACAGQEDPCCCSALSTLDLQLFLLLQITDERNLTETPGQVLLSSRNLRRESGAWRVAAAVW